MTHSRENDLVNTIKSVLFGVAVGDALGVPVEFKRREFMKKKPVNDMTGFGTYNLPPGTWSDDSSLTFCLAEALIGEFDLKRIGKIFVAWYRNNFWTATGHVFDIGNTTRQAIDRLAMGVDPLEAGLNDLSSNGNGSLMRISPLLFHIHDKPIDERYLITRIVSSITHGHIISVISCFYYLEFARQLLYGRDKFEAYEELKLSIASHLESIHIDKRVMTNFNRLLEGNIYELDEANISSSGYVVHTLEASVWCIMTTDNYSNTVLKAVNLGEDTDTTAAVAGGLAGLLYGYEDIPKKWIKQLARRDDIEHLAERLGKPSKSSI